MPLFFFPLDMVEVATPCTASWDEMAGDDRVRFCSQCRLHVYNISALTRAEAEALLQEKEGHLCTRFFRRLDGTILTQDCPIGVRSMRRWLASFLALAAAFTILVVGWLIPNRGSSHELQARRSPLREVEPFRTIMEWIDPTMRCTMGKPVPPASRNSGQNGNQVNRDGLVSP
jgi:hypothetical protein